MVEALKYAEGDVLNGLRQEDEQPASAASQGNPVSFVNVPSIILMKNGQKTGALPEEHPKV